MPATLRGPRVVLRPAEERDADAFAAILAEPGVCHWFGDDPLRAADAWARSADGVVFAIEVGGAVAGAIQYWEETDPDYRHAGIDLFLGDDHQGRGLGREALAVLARHLFDERGHHRLVIDPAAANARAIRAYERVGFRPIGVMRRYERDPAGGWRDGLLMDLLPEELESNAPCD